MNYITQKKNGVELNRPYEEDLAIHDWYRFVLSYPPHLVRDYINEFNLSSNDIVFDPFAGTGTTLVEAKKLGIKSFGMEANPVVHMCATTKITWSNIDHIDAAKIAKKIFKDVTYKIENEGVNYRTLPEETYKLLIKNSISEIPLHKTLILLESIDQLAGKYTNLFKTAVCKHAVFSFSNLRFGPEVGVSRKKKLDADVPSIWLNQVESMLNDLLSHEKTSDVESHIFYGDSRNDLSLIPDNSISAVITSPPYPNEKDYSRATRLELVLMGFIKDRKELQSIKRQFLRSNTKNIYKGDTDNDWITTNNLVMDLSKKIELERLSLGKTSGFEKLYHQVVKQYFGGMAKHLNDLKPKLKNKAKLAYVVGDQASYFKIPIRTGAILANIAENLGYKVVRTDLFRTRLATATKENLNEEVLILEYSKK